MKSKTKAKPAPTTRVAAIPAVDLEKMKRLLGPSYWDTESLLHQFSIPLDTIANCILVCQRVMRTSQRWQEAWKQWIVLSTKAVKAANDGPSAMKAMEEVPRLDDVANPDICAAALAKCVSFQRSYNGVRQVVMRAQQLHVIDYENYSDEALAIMRKNATRLEQFSWLCEQERRAVASAEPPSKAALTDAFFNAAKGKKRAEQVMLLAKIPLSMKPEFFRMLIKKARWSEKDLRAFHQETSSQKHNELSVIAREAIDAIILRKVEKASGYKGLMALHRDACGLPQAATLWREKMDAVSDAQICRVKNPDRLLSMFRNAMNMRLTKAVWDKLAGMTATAKDAEKLWQNVRARGGPYERLAPFERETLDIWLRLAGNDSEELKKIYISSGGSIEAYTRMVAEAANLSEALRIWEMSKRISEQKEQRWEIGLDGALRHVKSVYEGIEVLSLISNDSSSHRAAVVEHTLRVIDTPDDVERLARTIKDPDQEIRALIVLKLAKYCPLESATSAA